MIERHREEIELANRKFGQLEVGPNHEWFAILEWELPAGWNKARTRILVLLPPGYPVTPPDNFYADCDLRLVDGGMPGNASASSQVGVDWLQFSYHVESGDWLPHAEALKGHNLLTFLEGVRKRLQEAS